MKKTVLLSLLVSCSSVVSAGIPDSVYVRPYSRANGDGLRLEWSADKRTWENVSDGTIITSDFGSWGGRTKKMYSPSMVKGRDGVFAVVFQLFDKDDINQFGVTVTSDFVHFRPQDYPVMKGVKQCRKPVVTTTADGYAVIFESEGRHYRTTSKDLVHFTDPVQCDAVSRSDARMAYAMLEGVRNHQAFRRLEDARNAESASDDASRFQGLKGVKADIVVNGANSKAISNKLVGIFFEDINYSADGGLYAELVENRDFEYNSGDRREWNATTSWSLVGDGAKLTVETDNPIHANNSHYAVLNVSDPSAVSFQNSGFDGIPVQKGQKYDLSLFLRQLSGKAGKVVVSLKDDNKIIAKCSVSSQTNNWKQVKAVLTPTADCKKAVLCIEPSTTGKLGVDFVSLFPRNTFRGHQNGLRRDLAEVLERLNPKFMRFPGGCVTHGNGIDNIYKWKETIGPLWERKAQPNVWGYHQSKGLGYYEYFQFCEDLNMEPLPVLAAGVPCQNSSWGGHGQQSGISWDEMPAYLQDILDLIEWANGDAKTTEWGRKRAAQGHPKPFNLRYLGIGNEDLISPTFAERYLYLIKAVKEKYPEITICGTVGPFHSGSDYEEGWKIATANRIDMVDEHYYVSPSWYYYHQNYYDNYDRTSSKVYLGEYASHINGRKSTIETALSCAIHMCGVERNGDVVEMTSYAPLLAKEHHTQWNPDLIYFNNTEVKPTVDYYVQQLFGQCCGDQYIESSIRTGERRTGVNERLAVSTVRDSKSGKTYLKIVSALPVEVDAHLLLKDMGVDAEKSCKATVLKGAFDSLTAKPEQTTVQLSADCNVKVAPYSFTVVEL